MKSRNYILVANREDESAVDYTLEKCGVNRFWVPTPFGIKICDVEFTVWTLIRFFVLLFAAWIMGQRLKVQLRKAPGE